MMNVDIVQPGTSKSPPSEGQMQMMANGGHSSSLHDGMGMGSLQLGKDFKGIYIGYNNSYDTSREIEPSSGGDWTSPLPSDYLYTGADALTHPVAMHMHH